MNTGEQAATDGGSASLDLGSKLVMLLGGALASLAMVSISSVLPAIDTALARTPAESLLVKQLIGAVGLAMMIGSLLAGFLIGRVAVRTILFSSTLVYVLAGTAGLYLSDLRVLVASRMLLGLAAALIQITALTLINTRLQGPTRAHWMGLHISIAMVCTILVQPIAGLIGDHGWRLPFALHALGLLILPAVLTIHEQQRPATPKTAARRSEDQADRKAFWAVFPFHYLPLAILIGSIVFLPAIYAPFLLREKGLGNPSTIALVLTADSIAGAVIASQYGRARRYLTRHGAFATSFAIAAIGMLIAGLSSSVVGVIGGMLFYGLGVGWFVPNLMTALGEKIDGPRQAHAVGIVKAAHFTSAGLALLIMEPLSRSYGPQMSLIAMSCVSAFLLIIILLRSGVGRASPLRASLAPLPS
ncbi:MFS transporter [Novosphingobium sp. G106]|uniref:MFS transporter n=1 Tax=Novosphingobium sp. G106 TaxID=2849500 RepID=UPI001C2DD55B|nr:MFS transporter [Novosphingobium sp. G106]MBV1687684.1 MFS transporter [Novosphingobium sp. G106]